MEDRIDRLFNVLDRVSVWGTVLAGAVAIVWIILPVITR